MYVLNKTELNWILTLSLTLFTKKSLKQLPGLSVSSNLDENCVVEFSFTVELGTKAIDVILWSVKIQLNLDYYYKYFISCYEMLRFPGKKIHMRNKFNYFTMASQQ